MDNIVQFNQDFDNIASALRMIRAKDLQKIFLNTSPSTITKWHQDGILTGHKIGGGIYFKVSDIEALIEKSAIDYKIG